MNHAKIDFFHVPLTNRIPHTHRTSRQSDEWNQKLCPTFDLWFFTCDGFTFVTPLDSMTVARCHQCSELEIIQWTTKKTRRPGMSVTPRVHLQSISWFFLTILVSRRKDSFICGGGKHMLRTTTTSGSASGKDEWKEKTGCGSHSLVISLYLICSSKWFSTSSLVIKRRRCRRRNHVRRRENSARIHTHIHMHPANKCHGSFLQYPNTHVNEVAAHRISSRSYISNIFRRRFFPVHGSDANNYHDERQTHTRETHTHTRARTYSERASVVFSLSFIAAHMHESTFGE